MKLNWHIGCEHKPLDKLRIEAKSVLFVGGECRRFYPKTGKVGHLLVLELYSAFNLGVLLGVGLILMYN